MTRPREQTWRKKVFKLIKQKKIPKAEVVHTFQAKSHRVLR